MRLFTSGISTNCTKIGNAVRSTKNHEMAMRIENVVVEINLYILSSARHEYRLARKATERDKVEAPVVL